MPQDIRKAAILITSLPDDQAAELMSLLDPKQVEALSSEIAGLGSVSGDERQSTIQEFVAANPSSMAVRAGGAEAANEPLLFGFLQNVDNRTLLTVVKDEHPQTIALILSHLQPQQAAGVVKGLPPERRDSVIRRMATMGQTSPEIVKEVARGLQHRILKETVLVNVPEHAADMLRDEIEYLGPVELSAV
jgi:flagellar motor switch protein FliG